MLRLCIHPRAALPQSLVARQHQHPQEHPRSHHAHAREHQRKGNAEDLQAPANVRIDQRLRGYFGVDPHRDRFAALLCLAQGVVPALLPISHVVSARAGVEPDALPLVGLPSHHIAVVGPHLVGRTTLTIRMGLKLRIQHLRLQRLPVAHLPGGHPGQRQGTQPCPVPSAAERHGKDGTEDQQYAPPHDVSHQLPPLFLLCP